MRDMRYFERRISASWPLANGLDVYLLIIHTVLALMVRGDSASPDTFNHSHRVFESCPVEVDELSASSPSLSPRGPVRARRFNKNSRTGEISVTGG
ncbi:hypothetical protein RRG08_008289 [Elysia crispata]|uniref:Uncharacterized protein n=1 Tax=Elysia crispata TaxID=231223 RepID=A0AAE1DIP6_9GAST|nr:hypothetical protein RRG08_008289 [Elysia crispata]